VTLTEFAGFATADGARPPSSSCFTEDSNAADPTFLRDELDLPLSPI
jgi:hypothetical protein